MEAHTTLVNVDEDCASKLVSFVSNIFGSDEDDKKKLFNSTCSELIESGSFLKLIEKIVEESESMLSIDDEKGKFSFL